jgi:hypothetical protein
LTAQIIPFPQRGPFTVHVVCDGVAWLVVCRDYGWLHSNFRDAFIDAVDIASGFGVAVKVTTA